MLQTPEFLRKKQEEMNTIVRKKGKKEGKREKKPI